MSELIKRIEEVAAIKSVTVQAVTDALVKACKASILKAYGKDLDVEIGLTDGVLEAFAFKAVIPDNQSLTNSARQIHLSKAQAAHPEATLDDEYGEPINIDTLAKKVLDPGQLESLYDRYGHNGAKPKPSKLKKLQAVSVAAPLPPPTLPPRPPVEIVNGIERPWKDTRTREQIVADLQREVDTWKQQMVSQFEEKIEDYAKSLRELIEVNVGKSPAHSAGR